MKELKEHYRIFNPMTEEWVAQDYDINQKEFSREGIESWRIKNGEIVETPYGDEFGRFFGIDEDMLIVDRGIGLNNDGVVYESDILEFQDKVMGDNCEYYLKAKDVKDKVSMSFSYTYGSIYDHPSFFSDES